jgi:hypothetical protein
VLTIKDVAYPSMQPRLKHRAELQNARPLDAAVLGRQSKRSLVCTPSGCVASGSSAVFERLVALMKDKGVEGPVELREEPKAPLHDLIKQAGSGSCKSRRTGFTRREN